MTDDKTMTVEEALAELLRQFAEYCEHERDDQGCSNHEDAPHGFDRNGSHSMNRYVCDCEGWTPYPHENAELARRAARFIEDHGPTLSAALQARDAEVAVIDSLRATLKMQQQVIDALANNMRAIGCEWDQQTHEVINPRAEQAEAECARLRADVNQLRHDLNEATGDAAAWQHWRDRARRSEARALLSAEGGDA